MSDGEGIQGLQRRSRGTASWRRRGLFTGLAGAVAGVLAQKADRPVEAGHNGNAGANPLHLGLNNTNDTNATTTMTAVVNGLAFRVDNNAPNGSAIVGDCNGFGIAIRGNSSRFGVLGVSSSNAPSVSAPGGIAGVAGVGEGEKFGVLGQSESGAGVLGTSTSDAGVRCISTFGPGVHGALSASGPGSGPAVLGTAFGGGIGVQGATTTGTGVEGTAQTTGTGIRGKSDGGGIGVRGTTTTGTGVIGEATASGTGVRGNSTKIGLLGINAPNPAAEPVPAVTAGIAGVGTGTGIFGQATATTGQRSGIQAKVNGDDPAGFAVFAHAPDGAVGIRGTSGAIVVDPVTKIGVDGVSQQAGGIGVRGNGGDVGVKGTSPKIGVHGVTTAADAVAVQGNGFIGVAGHTDAATGTAVFGTTTTGTAGFFQGPVVVQGDFTVTGAKSAAVPLPGGTLGRTYAMECPDSWLSDFGEGQLTDGFRRVPIDPTFAATVDLSGQYHVVITPLADALLYVANRTPQSFEVRISSIAQQVRDVLNRDGRTGQFTPSDEPIRFTWWVIGRRKDIKGPRFEEVKVPQVPKLP